MIEIRTLGRTSITVDGEALSGEAAWPKSLALVVYMAREPGPDRRDQILGMLWPDREEKRARHALNQLLYTLRKASPELDLESIEDALDFGREVWLDVEEFERRLEAGDLEGAVELYRGPFLVDLSVDVPDFEHWADRQRTQLGRAFRRAALQLAQDAKVSGEHEAAIRYCRRLLGADPLDDEVQHLFIECLYLAGERVAALRQFEKYRDLLERELEVEPLDTTLELVEQIRSESPETAAVSEEVEEKGGLKAEGVERASAATGERAGSPTAAPRRTRAGPAGRETKRRRLSGWAVGTLALLFVAVALVAVMLLPVRGRITVGSDGSEASGRLAAARSLAVLPFSLQGSAAGLETSGAAIAELMAANLDGLGPIMPLDNHAIAAAWEEGGLEEHTKRAPSELAELGRSLGATAVLVGTVHEDGGQIRLVADALSTEDGHRLARADVRGPADSIFALTDRLTIELAGALWGEAGVAASRITATRSVKALKHYLRGREHHRRGEWGEAVADLRRAGAEDATYLAAWRMLGDAVHLAEMEPEAAYQQSRHVQRMAAGAELSPVERAFDDARLELMLGRGRSAIVALEALAERWPDDREIADQLADAYFHYGWRLGFNLDAVERQLSAALARDSLFAPAIDHLWWTAMWRGDEGGAKRWARAYRAAAPRGLWSDMAALTTGLVSGSPAEAGLGAGDAGLAVLAASLPLDSGPERPGAIAAAFAADPISVSRRKVGVELLAFLAFASGRPATGAEWLDSARVLGLAESESRARETLAALYDLGEGLPNAHPAPAVRPVGVDSDAGRLWVRDVWLHGAVAARNGDRAVAELAATSLDALPDTTLRGQLGRRLAAALRAELALARGDSTEALRELRRATASYTAYAPLSRWETLPYYRLRLGELEVERGEHEAAVTVLRTLFDRSLGDVLVRGRAAQAMAQCLEALGETEEARRHRAAAARWSAGPDPSPDD